MIFVISLVKRSWVICFCRFVASVLAVVFTLPLGVIVWLCSVIMALVDIFFTSLLRVLL